MFRFLFTVFLMIPSLTFATTPASKNCADITAALQGSGSTAGGNSRLLDGFTDAVRFRMGMQTSREGASAVESIDGGHLYTVPETGALSRESTDALLARLGRLRERLREPNPALNGTLSLSIEGFPGRIEKFLSGVAAPPLAPPTFPRRQLFGMAATYGVAAAGTAAALKLSMPESGNLFPLVAGAMMGIPPTVAAMSLLRPPRFILPVEPRSAPIQSPPVIQHSSVEAMRAAVVGIRNGTYQGTEPSRYLYAGVNDRDGNHVDLILHVARTGPNVGVTFGAYRWKSMPDLWPPARTKRDELTAGLAGKKLPTPTEMIGNAEAEMSARLDPSFMPHEPAPTRVAHLFRRVREIERLGADEAHAIAELARKSDPEDATAFAALTELVERFEARRR